ncbi:MAG TPA: hypothetical protein VFN25_13580 [Dokdonella sp.]|uniref:hypothetical protein n=1 Tax=Dokdonella sp. TaxID=2291710 RepID=UPI002D7F7E4C|nr:hypothetical protein [Dokdonella sp.]HET9033920.1 hypothetical protein [Dokdonella sp.]
MRKSLFAIAMLFSVAAILAWAAGMQWSSPLVASQPRHWDGSDFRVVIGGAAQDETRLRIGAVGENRTALQSIVLNGIEAADNPILRYHFEQFPHTLELSLVFRRVGNEDVTVVSLPWPGDGDAWFDLGTVPEWQGRITELAFAEYPTPQIVPPMQGFRPFTLVNASLSSRSWLGDLSALATDWLGQWPWSQRSVHALGRDTDTPRAQSLQLCLMLIIASLLLWSWLILRVRGSALLRLSVITFVLGWLLLDLQWQSGLNWRHAATESLYAEFDWPERELHSADHDIVETAHELKSALRDLPENSRILVHAESSFTVLRLVYHLLPLNVGVLAQAIDEAPGQPLPEGSVVIVYDTPGWTYDQQHHLLQGGGLKFGGELLLRRNRLLVLRVRRQP